jgi:RNA-binding protein
MFFQPALAGATFLGHEPPIFANKVEGLYNTRLFLPDTAANRIMSSLKSSKISNSRKKQLRTIGHNLNPIVTIAEKGVTETINKELERALEDHELIKIKINVNDSATRKEIAAELCKKHRAELIQSIGKVAILCRAARKPNPKLSNLLRPV